MVKDRGKCWYRGESDKGVCSLGCAIILSGACGNDVPSCPHGANSNYTSKQTEHRGNAASIKRACFGCSIDTQYHNASISSWAPCFHCLCWLYRACQPYVLRRA